MTPRKAKRTERKPKVNWRKAFQDLKADTEMIIDCLHADLRETRAALSRVQKERDDAFKRANDYCVERNAADVTLSKRDIAIADLNAELREKDATISGLREIEGKLNARVGELERDYESRGELVAHLQMELNECADFKSDLMLLMASQWDVMCGTRLINVRAISMLLEKYQ